jgi:predicted short-subunit dehydrogenase-like oxidoreductase (DUF2520 family)
MASIVLIGSGNVATCLGKAMQHAGMEIRAVYSRNLDHATVLANELHTKATDDIGQLPADADLYLLAVKDTVIATLSEQLNVQGTVVHCSGMMSAEVLGRHPHYGVLWPVQTLTKAVQPDFRGIPFCVEGSDLVAVETITGLAQVISGKVAMLSFSQRQSVHLAAVFANNFSNHLFHMASALLAKQGISFDLLRPLIAETARKVQEHLPAEVQTGPAARNDLPTIEAHRALLNDHPDYRKLYELLSAAIGKETGNLRS